MAEGGGARDHVAGQVVAGGSGVAAPVGRGEENIKLLRCVKEERAATTGLASMNYSLMASKQQLHGLSVLGLSASNASCLISGILP